MKDSEKPKKVILSVSVKPEIIRNVDLLLRDTSYRSRSECIEDVILTYLLDYGYIDYSEYCKYRGIRL